MPKPSSKLIRVDGHTHDIFMQKAADEDRSIASLLRMIARKLAAIGPKKKATRKADYSNWGDG